VATEPLFYAVYDPIFISITLSERLGVDPGGHSFVLLNVTTSEKKTGGY
jgi:hypothetical protein